MAGGGSALLRSQTNIDFIPLWKKGLIISGLLVVVSIGALFVRNLNLGIDFEGGISWEVKAPGVSVDEARDVLTELGEGDAKIQIVGDDVIRVQGPASSEKKQNEVAEALAEMAGAKADDVSISTVGPSWGDEITASAIKALVFFFLAIMLYLSLRLEWRMAVGALAAVLHDIIISVGVYSLFQFEVTPATVIVFLTILGYSIYDTIVVFDKVKENAARPALANKLTYTELMNLSMNQVLLRSINTTVVSILPVLSLLVVGSFFLGAVTLQEFALALAVGLGVGAYSSIFVAAPIVVFLKEREPVNRHRPERLERGLAQERDDRTAEVRATDGPKRSGRVATATAAVTDTEPAPAEGVDEAVEPAPRASRKREASPSPAAESPGAATPGLSRNHPPRPRKKGRRR